MRVRGWEQEQEREGQRVAGRARKGGGERGRECGIRGRECGTARREGPRDGGGEPGAAPRGGDGAVCERDVEVGRPAEEQSSSAAAAAPPLEKMRGCTLPRRKRGGGARCVWCPIV